MWFIVILSLDLSKLANIGVYLEFKCHFFPNEKQHIGTSI